MGNITGRAGAAMGGATSELFSDASKIPQLGTRATDDSGNEFILVDFGSSQPATGFHYGEYVSFDQNYLATRITTTSRGWVGVVMAGAGANTITTTLRYGWVQVYGINTFTWGTSDVTSATMLYVVATTDIGYLQGLATTTDVLGIFGVRAVSAADSCASTALSTSSLAAPFSAQLTYPFVSGALLTGAGSASS